MLRCADRTFYIGYTTDVHKRVKTHNDGKGAKYTKGRLPVKLIWYEEYEDKSSAMRREYQLKQMDRNYKKSLLLYECRDKKSTE